MTPQSNGTFVFINTPDKTVIKGFEAEARLVLSESLSGFANYSCQSGRNEKTNEVLVGMANWRANLGLNASLSDQWNLGSSLNIVGRRQRVSGDPRQELSTYRVMDVALTYTPIQNLDLSLTAHNLFDADQRYPDITGQVPNDFPWEGRSIQGKVRWRF
jgi:outer membrane receptor protein involved in Fe transport